MHFLKSLLKLFCVAILILKMEGKKGKVWHIMHYYFNKGKNATEMQKIVYREVRLIKCVKSGLWNFLLEIFC